MLLALRLLALALLYAFIGAVAYALWKDYIAASKAAAERERSHGRLIVIEAPAGSARPGRIYALHPITSLGRAPTNTVPLEDSFVSQEHALISLRDGRWWLEDLESSNGTLLNGIRIDEPTVISDGDVIELGRIKLKVELLEDE